jgi:hypothetical protein
MVAGRQADLGDRDDQRQAGRAVEGEAQRPGARQVAPVGDQHRHAPDRQDQHEEHQQPRRVLNDGLDIQLHPRHDEERRDEEAEAEALQLVLEHVVAVGQGHPQHDPGCERAEHDIEAELARQQQQPDQQQHADPDRRLRRGLRPAGDQFREGPALHPAGHVGDQERDQRERDEDRQRLPRAAPAEEHRDRDDREQFADRPVGHDRLTEGPPVLAGVAEDRQQRAERGGGEGDRDRQERLDEVGRPQASDDREGGRDRHEPEGGRLPAGRAEQRDAVEFEPGEEEEEAEADIRDEVDLRVDLGEPQRLGADGDPQENQEDDLGDPRPGEPPDDQRRDGGNGDDQEEGVEPLGDLHPSGAPGHPNPSRSGVSAASRIDAGIAARASASVRARSARIVSRRAPSVRASRFAYADSSRRTTCGDAAPNSPISE